MGGDGRYELIVIGAGPAGLSAAINAANFGVRVVIFDENPTLGGQLFKQTHKFFGSKEHFAKKRGFSIARILLEQTKNPNITLCLNTSVIGIYPNKEILAVVSGKLKRFRADAIIAATGATSNAVPFEGWNLPNVIDAGAAQTMVNIHGVRPGNDIFVLGSGNVGLVVSYQLIQAGCRVAAVADASETIGGYGVHAAKLARLGVPFYTKHTIVKANGGDRVSSVTIARLENGGFVAGTEKTFDVDCICAAVGLSPQYELLDMAGAMMTFNKERGGRAPVVNERGATTVDGIFAAGDISGVEEATSAMIEGRIAGASAAYFLGYADESAFAAETSKGRDALDKLRHGMFTPQNKTRKLSVTDEGCPLSVSLRERGFLEDFEVANFPGVNLDFINKEPVVPVIECTQNIPCNPCQDACPRGCIKVGRNITDLPAVEDTSICVGCGLCVAACPGQAIFLIHKTFSDDFGLITMPYEFLPLPRRGDVGAGLSRDGGEICAAEVIEVRTAEIYDKTALLTIKVPTDMLMRVRFYKR
ncbi:hypothetical protein FACS1894188_07420 [Clostridia bacterium]|nr:hypothetical protein FACS1894188_07420 [Clostridia bacterium]